MRIPGIGGTTPRRRFLAVTAAAGLLGSLLVSVATVSAAEESPRPGGDKLAEARALAWAKKRLARMTLEEKVGQLFVTYAYGQTVDSTDPTDVKNNQNTHGVDNAQQLIEKYHLGGIIYFAWSNNLANPRQIAELSNGIQRVGLDQRSGAPLLISTDQEQGIVNRVGPPATEFPGSMALGAGRSKDDAHAAARITGRELRALGINQNYAPVADVNVNPQNPVIGVRSFSEDPQLAAELTAAQVSGYQAGRDGVAATAKHFPGHGDTDVDSHFGFPVINHTREEWEKLDAPPFQAAIDAGVDSIMTAHIQIPALDPSDDPATLSKPVITDVLRGELGYDGVVVTDSLGMAGVRQKYGDDRVPVLALKAGVDMLLMPPKIEVAYTAVLEAVRGGELTEKRINTSALRVLKLKHLRGLVDRPLADVEKIDTVVGTPQHVAAAQEITDRTTTLVKNDAGLLPLAAGPRDVLVTGRGVTTTRTLAEAIDRRGAATTVYETGLRPSQATVDQAVSQAGDKDLVVVVSYRAWTYAQQRNLVKQLVATGKPVIVLAVGDPYDIAYFTEAETYLAAYSFKAPALEAATKVLFGEISPAGKLPVTIPVATDPGTALYEFGHGLSY